MNARMRWLLGAVAVAAATALPTAIRATGPALGDACVLALRVEMWSQSLARVATRFADREIRS